jgi:uncharacterized membrane protein YqjE
LFKKLNQNKRFILGIQLLSMVLILIIKIDIVLKLMLLVGYFMLFRQERWHKHLLVMFVMIVILSLASGSFNSLYK